MIDTTEELIRDWLKGFTYKPDWQFKVSGRMFEVVLIVRAELPDVNSVRDFTDMTIIPKSQYELLQPIEFKGGVPWQKIPILYGPIGANLAVPPFFQNRCHFFIWLLRDAIPRLEGHESIEWARVNGAPIFNPHPDGGSASYPDPNNYMLKDEATK